MKRHVIILLGIAVSLFLCRSAAAQEVVVDPTHIGRPLKKTLELKARENRVFEHDSTFFTFRLNNRFSESYFYR